MFDTTARNISDLSVLVVDDNSHMLHIIETMLRSLKIAKVKRAENGKVALEILQMMAVDIVITDWNMEPMSGIELVRHLRADKSGLNANVPIIMVTGFTEMDRVLEARDAGINGFLKKPLSTKALYDRIAEIASKTAETRDEEEEWSVGNETSPPARSGS